MSQIIDANTQTRAVDVAVGCWRAVTPLAWTRLSCSNNHALMPSVIYSTGARYASRHSNFFFQNFAGHNGV